MRISVLSGKGGTGKTLVSTNLAWVLQDCIYIDCDIEEPNGAIFLKPEIEMRKDVSVNVPRINEDKCRGCRECVSFCRFNALAYIKDKLKVEENCLNCGRCEELCRFGAIENGRVNIFDCEGCGVCEYFCTAREKNGISAIRLKDNVSGYTYLSRIDGELFSHAELKTGNGASGKLVTEVRKKLFNNISNEELLIIDGSPGIGCPVIASITGADMALVVAEPTLSGLHDMKRIVETARRFGTECVVCINKHDINPEITRKIEEYCDNEGIYNAGRIPYDPIVPEAININKSIVEYPESSACKAVKELWKNLSGILS